jgi:hypothetical protein
LGTLLIGLGISLTQWLLFFKNSIKGNLWIPAISVSWYILWVLIIALPESNVQSELLSVPKHYLIDFWQYSVGTNSWLPTIAIITGIVITAMQVHFYRKKILRDHLSLMGIATGWGFAVTIGLGIAKYSFTNMVLNIYKDAVQDSYSIYLSEHFLFNTIDLQIPLSLIGIIVGTGLGFLTGSLLILPNKFRRIRNRGSVSRLLSYGGAVIFILSISIIAHFSVIKLNASYIGAWAEAFRGEPCSRPIIKIAIDRVIITNKETISVSAILQNYEQEACDADVSIQAPKFLITPQQVTRTLSLNPGESAELMWILTPTDLGTYEVGFTSSKSHRSVGIVVTNSLGLTAKQVEILSYIGTFLGPAFTFPWLFTTWQQYKKDKKNSEEIERLKKDIEKQEEPSNK